MDVINKHTARVAGIAPGETGTADAENPTIKAMLAEGLLVDVEVERRRLAASLGPSEEERLRARVAELEAALAAKAPAKPATPKAEGAKPAKADDKPATPKAEG